MANVVEVKVKLNNRDVAAAAKTTVNIIIREFDRLKGTNADIAQSARQLAREQAQSAREAAREQVRASLDAQRAEQARQRTVAATARAEREEIRNTTAARTAALTAQRVETERARTVGTTTRAGREGTRAEADVVRLERERSKAIGDSAKAESARLKVGNDVHRVEKARLSTLRESIKLQLDQKRLERTNNPGVLSGIFGGGGGGGGAASALIGAVPGLAAVTSFAAAATAAVAFGKAAVQASLEATAANRILASSALVAGQSYVTALDGARKLGQQLALSNTDANRTYSQLLTLAKNSGQVENLDLISQRIADVAAAKGYKGQDIETLVSQLISGQDEALNRIGIKDPSGLYKDFVVGTGRAVDSLSEFERTQIRVNAVLKLGEQVQGSAANRLRSADGAIAGASAAWENFTASVGDSITQSLEFRDVLVNVSEALEFLTGNHRTAREELLKGLKTPQEIGKEAAQGGLLRTILDGASLTYGLPKAVGGSIANTLLYGTRNAASAVGLGKGQSFNEYSESIRTTLIDPSTRRGQEAEAEGERILREELARKAGEAKEKFTKLAIEENRKTENANTESLSRRIDADTRFYDSVREMSERNDALIQRNAETQAQVLTGVYQRAEQVIGNSFSKLQTDNPFVNIFAQGIRAAEQAEKDFGRLGSKIVKQVQGIELGVRNKAIASERFESGLRALDLRQEARRLSAPAPGLSGDEERAASIGTAQINAAVEAAKAKAEIENIQRQIRGQNPIFGNSTTPSSIQNAASQLQSLTSISTYDPRTTPAVARQIQKSIDDAILAATEIDFSNAPSASDVGGQIDFYNITQARTAALSRRGDSQQDAVREAIDQARASAQIVADAREKIAETERLRQNTTGLVGKDEALRLADRQVLQIVRDLVPNERTADLRLGARESGLREAERESRKEAEAAKAIEEDRVFRADILKGVSDAVIELNKGLKVLIEFNQTTNSFEASRTAGPVAPSPVTTGG